MDDSTEYDPECDDIADGHDRTPRARRHDDASILSLEVKVLGARIGGGRELNGGVREQVVRGLVAWRGRRRHESEYAHRKLSQVAQERAPERRRPASLVVDDHEVLG